MILDRIPEILIGWKLLVSSRGHNYRRRTKNVGNDLKLETACCFVITISLDFYRVEIGATTSQNVR